jgi:hypothetical protein
MATSGAENRPAWPSIGRRTKRAEYQSLDAAVGPIPGRCGPNPAMDKETRAAEKRGFFAQKVTFSATKVLAAGFNPVRASTRPRRCQAHGLRTASPRAVVMPAIPEPRPQREKAISLCGDYCSRLSSPPSSELFGRPTHLTLCDEISSFVVHQPEFGETWSQAFL